MRMRLKNCVHAWTGVTLLLFADAWSQGYSDVIEVTVADGRQG